MAHCRVVLDKDLNCNNVVFTLVHSPWEVTVGGTNKAQRNHQRLVMLEGGEALKIMNSSIIQQEKS